MFKIGEFSKLTQVSIRMLRYYDEMDVLKPAEIDKFTNYRLYSSKQIPILNKILFLRDLGFNVSEITMALKEWDSEYITRQLEHKRLEILSTIKAEENKLLKIELAKKDIQEQKIEINYNVIIKSLPSYQVFSLRRIVSDYYAEGLMWKEILHFTNKHRIPISSNTFTIYHDTDYRENDVDIEVCAPVARMGESTNGFTYRKIEPVSLVASAMVYGPFENISAAYLSFANWLSEHNQYRMLGQSRQIVHRGQWNENSPEKYLTEIQIPLEHR